MLHRSLREFRSILLSPIYCQTRTFKQENVYLKPPSLIDTVETKVSGEKGIKYASPELYMAGENMFAICSEYPEFEQFVQHLKLPDTFQSWFSLTALHIWMCLVRLRQEGNDGRILKRRFVELFWMDLRPRIRSFNVVTGVHRQVQAFRMQFYGSVFAYDEGFLSNSDAQMTNALWRNLFTSSSDVGLKELELALDYTRKNLAHLDTLSESIVVKNGTPYFLPLIGNEINKDYINRRVNYCVTLPSYAPK